MPLLAALVPLFVEVVILINLTRSSFFLLPFYSGWLKAILVLSRLFLIIFVPSPIVVA